MGGAPRKQPAAEQPHDESGVPVFDDKNLENAAVQEAEAADAPAAPTAAAEPGSPSAESSAASSDPESPQSDLQSDSEPKPEPPLPCGHDHGPVWSMQPQSAVAILLLPQVAFR